MSAVHPIPTPTTNPNRTGGFPTTQAPSLPPDWPTPAASTAPPTSAESVSPPHRITGSPSHASLPPLTPDQDRLFEALAKGQTSPAELSATLNLPVRQILTLLATPEIAFHLEVFESAIDYLARHTTRLRHNLAFKSLESALTTAAAKDNPGEIRRIATLLLKPTPPLPDPEAEQAERAERITRHRRAVKQDAQSEQKDAERAALAAAMVARSSGSLSRFPGGAGEGRGEGMKTQHTQQPQRAATPASTSLAHSTAPTAPNAPAPNSPSHRVAVSPSHASHSPAQPRAA